MAWVVGVISVGPPLAVDPAGEMPLRISNKQTNKQIYIYIYLLACNVGYKEHNIK